MGHKIPENAEEVTVGELWRCAKCGRTILALDPKCIRCKCSVCRTWMQHHGRGFTKGGLVYSGEPGTGNTEGDEAGT